MINGIPKSSLVSLLSAGKYEQLKKGVQLFSQGDKSALFFLILSGKLSFTILKKSDNSSLEEEEREVNVLNEGNFFGEWGLIYNIKRTTSTYAKENSILLSFDKKIFNSTIAMNLLRSEIDRKVFICSHIKKFNKLNTVQFNTFYRNIKKVYLEFNDIVFKQNEPADSFYLIYKGSCSVKRGSFNLLIKDVGDIIGIESLEENSLYYSTVSSNSNSTVLFKLVLKDFTHDFVNDLREDLCGFIDQQTQIFNKCLESHLKMKNSIEEKYENLSRNKAEKQNNLFTPSYISIMNKTDGKSQELWELSKKKNIIIKQEPKILQSKMKISKFKLNAENNSNNFHSGGNVKKNSNTRYRVNITQYTKLAQKTNSSMVSFPQISTSFSKEDFSTFSSLNYNNNINPGKIFHNSIIQKNMVNSSTQVSKREKTERKNFDPGRKVIKNKSKIKTKEDISFTLSQKIGYSVKRWKKILINKKDNFETKRYKIPLIFVNTVDKEKKKFRVNI